MELVKVVFHKLAWQQASWEDIPWTGCVWNGQELESLEEFVVEMMTNLGL